MLRASFVVVLASLLAACTSSPPSSTSNPPPPPPPPARYPPAPLGTVVAELTYASQVVTDGTDLYVTSGGGSGSGSPPGLVSRLTPGGTVTTLATASSPWGIAVDAAYVYFCDAHSATLKGDWAGRIRRVPKGGGTIDTLALSAAPEAIAVDDTNVYWLDDDRLSNTILSMAKTPGDASAVSLAEFDASVGNGIALDSAHVYWTEVHQTTPFQFHGSLGRVPKVGGAAETLTTGSMWGTPASDDGGVYFGVVDVDASTLVGQVFRFDPKTRATLPVGMSSTVEAIYSTGTYVYWLDDNWGVFAAPLAGGATVRLASARMNGHPKGLTVLHGVVYWAEFGFGAILSIPGPEAQ